MAVATNYMERIGVAHIVVQEKNGSTWRGVAIYWGSVANGMMVTNAITHFGSVSYNGTIMYNKLRKLKTA